MVNHHELMKKMVTLILLLLLTSVWSNVCAGLYDNQSRAVVSSTELTLCTPGTFLLGNYEFAFPKADSTTHLQLEYFDMLNCYAQHANLTLLPSSIITEPTYDTICAGESYEWNGKTYSKPGSYTDTLSNIHGCDSIVTLHLHVLPDPPLTFTVNGVSFKMMRVRSGTFMMGATPEQGTDAQDNEKPAHKVTLTRDYFVSETVLTQALWTAVMGTTIQEEEAKGTGEKNLGYGDNFPMYCLSHNDCLLFVERLNQLTGLTFRMPTEAEWEYAARGGHLSRGYKYPGSNDPFEVAWSIENDPQKKLHPVKLLKPNELGLYDMAGNVWEYIYDFRRTYTAEPQVNPMGNISGNQANIRGGSTAWNTGYNRVSCRHIPTGISKDEKSGRRAFRFVLDADRVIGEDNTTYQAYDTICAGESYEWNSKTYTKPGSYTDTLTNIHGCDSIVTLHLHVLPDPPLTFTVNGVSFKMMRVRAGSFMMGATDDDPDAEVDEKPRHKVTLTKDYFIAETEMTQALWQAIMGNNPSEDKSNPQSPVNNVSWDDCQEMIAKLNELTGLTFRLPTEAEWEYAARAGYYSRGYIYAGSNNIDEVAWYNKPNNASVASLKPNEIGIYDMSGSVYEWCQDWYDPNAYQSPDHRIDPFQATNVDNGLRCLRGGSNKASQGIQTKKYSRLANRGHINSNTKASHVGLRLALETTGIMENNREFVTYDTICAGETITWNGKTYTKPGYYTDTLSNIHGCDSIVTLHLHVLPDPPLTFTVNGVSFKMMRVRAGSFMMGATPEQGTDAQDNEKPAHQVTLTRDYFMAETMLTQELWTAVMGTTIQEEETKGSGDTGLGYGANYPMYCISYYDCLNFVERLNQLTGLTFRMPTEAEWEYAARGGHLSRGYKYPGSNDPHEVAWNVSKDSNKKLHEVKQLLPNELGLYDMAGNTWEWIFDYNRQYKEQSQTDPIGDTTSNYAFIRGGSSYYLSSYNRVSCRGKEYNKTFKANRIAFRFVLDADRVIGEDNTTYQAYDTICAGDTYTWNGNTYTKPGHYTDTLSNIHGCDSIVTLHLHVNPTYEVHDTIVACDSYTWHEDKYEVSGVYYDSLQSINGCDSVFVLHLTINKTVYKEETVTACDSYTWNGQTYTTSGDYPYTTTAANGCDSITTLHLTINYRDTAFFTETACDSYEWHEEEYTESGTYYYHTQTKLGCDSLEVLNLTVNYRDTAFFTKTACDSYEWHDQVYNTSGIYYYNTQTMLGCDSIEVLNLTINYRDTAFFTQTACDSYEWHDQVYNTSGIYYYNTQTILGCDSVEVLNLTINYRDTAFFIVTECDSYEWHGEEYTESGTYYYHTQTMLGCDSVEVLNLTINYRDTAFFTETACDSYEWHGDVFTESGTYYYHTQTKLGCDSLEVLHLTINYSDTAFFTETACDSYEWHDQVYNVSGTYYYHTQTMLGCDSVEVLNLTINYRDTAFFTETACDSYTWHNQVYNVSGTYYYHTQTKLGCDSVEVLNLTINYRDTAFFTETACDSYTWHDQVYNTSGTYYYNTQTMLGCDSVEVLNLTINYRDTAFFTQTACDSYTWHDQVYNTSGIYYYHTQTKLGCDSVEVLNLTVNYRDTAFFTETACDSYTWHDHVYNTSGIYYYNTQTMLGCDSLEVLHLTINYSDTAFITETACDSYEWHGDVFTESGTYYYHTQTKLGCDSLEVLTLTINYSDTVFITETACDSYEWHGDVFTESGTYYYHTQTMLGCDSVEVLNLTINYRDTAFFTETACDSYEWHGEEYTESGTYYYYTQTMLGCDSVEVLNLTINYRDTAFFTVTECDSYEWHDQVYNTSGIYYYNTQTMLGCDSLEVLYLTINYSDTVFITETACDSYEWHDQVYNVSGTYYYHTQTKLGCDSVEVLNLTVNYRDTAFFTATACDSYEWHEEEYTESGTYYYHTQTMLGCDSVEVLNLTINYRDTAFFTQTACESYKWHSDVYTESGTYYHYTQTMLGCDSVEIMRLTILPPTKYLSFDTLLCHGVTCEWRDMQLTTAGTYNDTVKNQLNCDSLIYILHLEYLPDVELFATDTALCYGEVCDWRGVTYKESGIYHDTIRNSLSCDSLIYTLNLIIYPEIPITHVVDTMAGAEYHWNDQIYTHGGEYTVTLPAITGCDSVVILHLMDNYAAIDTVIVYEQCAGSGEQEVEILTQGYIEQIVLNYSPQAQAAGLRDTVMMLSSTDDIYTIYYDDVRAGVHEVTAIGLFHGKEVASYPFTLTYLYPNTIFEQRYNDLIAVLTHDYNGGYDFTAFQWYKDGVLLPGETHSYLNQSLSFESEYSVLLTNTDGLQLMSCPIIAEDKAELSVYPTILKHGEMVKCHMTDENMLFIHNSTGKIIQEQPLKAGTTAITLPAISGVYLFRFVSNDHIERTFKVIVQ